MPTSQEIPRQRVSLFESRTVRRLLLGAVAVGALILAFAGWGMSSIDRKFRAACQENQRKVGCTPHGIVDWELAFTKARARDQLVRWRYSPQVELPDDPDRSLERDNFFIAGYVLLFVALLALAAPCFKREPRKRWFLLFILPPVAGALDLLENALLRRQLEGLALDTSLAGLAGTAASLKFVALAVPTLALLTLGVACITRRISSSELGGAAGFEEVLAAEHRYLRDRRTKAGLARGASYTEPVGLAFSGGGIRSATFNLGVLQALARLRLLPKFDYLSTVSGGGYIGAALSSLLSISGKKAEESASGSREQHEFGPHDPPRFSTESGSFPFERGSVPEEHLRASSRYLVGRQRLFSMELLRTVGGPAFGFLYHLLHFGLLLVAFSAGYLWIVYMWVGKPGSGPKALLAETYRDPFAVGWPPSTPEALAEVYRAYFREVIGLEALARISDWWQHPFVIAFVVGGLVTAATVWFCRKVVEALPDEWYSERGRTAAEGRQEDSVIALAATMILTGFLVITFFWFAAIERELLNVSLPLVSYLGGGAFLLGRHAFIAMRKGYASYDRSRLAARQGAFIYLVIASFIFMLIMLPSLVFFDALKDELKGRPVRGVLTWLVTVAGARLFAGSLGGKETGGGSTGPLASLLPVARKLFLGVVFTVALLGSVVLICALIWTYEPEVTQTVTLGGFVFTGPALFRFGVLVAATVAYFLTGRLNFNKLSLHYFYRDRLVEAYLRTSQRKASSTVRTIRDNEGTRLTDLHGVGAGGGEDALTKCVTSAPYHLIVTALNLTAGREKPSRKTDRFVFSKLYCGSETTGYAETRKYRAGSTSLARAMTVSGAAVSPAMGSASFFAQSAAMTLLNVRLGQWMENPGYRGGEESWRREGSILWPWYLLKEATASTDAQSRLVYLSDGGHAGDNIGICPLLERRCRLIIAVDAEQDEGLALHSFNEAVRQIRIDDRVEVKIDLKPIQTVSEGISKAHCAIGKISYPATSTRGAATGWLILLKASLTGDESGPIMSYRARNPQFPHQSTGDQLFDEAQFESYRELGEHIVSTSLKKELLRLVGDELADPPDRWNEAFEKLV